MGVNCIIKTDNDYYGLDRWYVFSSKIESGKKMNRSKALKKIRDLKRTKTLKKETFGWGERQNEFIEYHKNFLLLARNIIKSTKTKTVTFFKDNDEPDEYYE